jgi:hypothetical protein
MRHDQFLHELITAISDLSTDELLPILGKLNQYKTDTDSLLENRSTIITHLNSTKDILLNLQLLSSEINRDYK